MKRILIVGGHLTPALALIEELQKNKEVQILFIGRKLASEGSKAISAEYTQVKNKKIKFLNLTSGRLQRKLTRHTFFSLLKIPVGFVQSFFFQLLERPNLVVSFGGYLSLPVIFCAWLLAVRSITHEQASIGGLANRLNSLFVEKIFVSWGQTSPYFPKSKTELIGNLCRSAIFKKSAKSKMLAQFLNKEGKLIYVTGGNQGSHIINKFIFNNLEIFSKFKVLHGVGTLNFQGDFDNAKKIKRQNYMAVDFIGDDDIGAVLNSAHIVISRAGANTVWELATLAKVAILIPLPIAASSEQEANANILKKAGSTVLINQDDVTSVKIKNVLKEITTNYPKYQKAATNFSKTIPHDASSKLAQYIVKTLAR